MLCAVFDFNSVAEILPLVNGRGTEPKDSDQ